MSKTKTTIFGLSVSFLFVGPVLADPVDIPNQFQAGTPAVADEVNQNFSAVETAVDDNAADIATNETAIGELQSSIDQVMVAGVIVGRFFNLAAPPVALDLPLGAGPILVAEDLGGGSGSTVGVISPLGYLFRISSSNFSNPLSQEGQVMRFALTFDQINCTGNRYIPVEGNTGGFSTFTPGSGLPRPVVRWVARSGFVFASPDVMDPNQVYFVRKNAAVTTVALQSVQFIDTDFQTVVCFSFAGPADHSVVPAEINDPAVTSVNGILGGDISIDF